MNDSTRKRHRSPNFPIIDLETALDRALHVYFVDKGHPVPMAVIHDRWGYKAMSGRTKQTVAALTAYGLLEDVGGAGDKREVKVSDALRKIALTHTDAGKLLKEAAVKPKVFENLWKKYGEKGLPSDDTIRHYLTFDYEPPFNEDSVDICINAFKKSIEFANLAESDIIEPQEGDESSADQSGKIEKPLFAGRHNADNDESKHEDLFKPPGNSNQFSRGKDKVMVVTDSYELPNAKLSLRLEQLDQDTPISSEDLEMAEYYLDGFKKVMSAKLRRATAESGNSSDDQ